MRRSIRIAIAIAGFLSFTLPSVGQDMTSKVPASEAGFSRSLGAASASSPGVRRLSAASPSGSRLVLGGTTAGIVVADIDAAVPNVRVNAGAETVARAFLAQHISAILPGVPISELVLAPEAMQCGEAPDTPGGKSGRSLTYFRRIGDRRVLGGTLVIRVGPSGTVLRVQNTIPAVGSRVTPWNATHLRRTVDAGAFRSEKRPTFSSVVRNAQDRLRISNAGEPVLVPVRTSGFNGMIEARRILFPRESTLHAGLLLADGTILTPTPVTSNQEGGRVPVAHIDPVTKLPTFLSFRPQGRSPSLAGIVSNSGEVALRFLEENPAMFRTGQARCQFEILDVGKDPASPRTTFIKLGQRIAGRRVFGGQLVFEIQDGARVMSIQGHTIGHAKMPLVPAITPSDAIQTARQRISDSVSTAPADIRTAVQQSKFTSELLVFGGELFPLREGKPLPTRLAYLVQNSLQASFVDAVTGKEIFAYSRSNGANIVNDGAAMNHLGRPLYTTVNVDGVPVPGAPANADVPTAVAGVATTAGFYAAHGWVGQNGTSAGSNFVANTNVLFAFPFVGNLCPNANYLQPTDETFFCLGLATTDVVGHEFTHGVIHHSSDLVYADESGALNESYADIMGNLAFPDAIPAGAAAGTLPGWLLGETTPGGALRNMAAPAVGNYTGYLSRTDLGCNPLDLPGVIPPCDAGGVHTNSGINNRAHVLMSDGGLGGLTGMTRGRLRMVAFDVMTRRLVSSSRLIDAALASLAACDMFVATGGTTFDTPPLTFTQLDCDQVMPAFAAVGLEPDLVSNWLPPTLGFGGAIVRYPAETTDNGCTVTDIALQMNTPSGLLDANALASPGGVPTINYLGIMTATIPITTPPIGTLAKTHTIAWTSIFGQTPEISSSITAPAPAGANNCVSPAGTLPVERTSADTAAPAIPVIGGTGTVATGNAASNMALACLLRITEVELRDGGNTIAGPGPTATHNTVILVFGVPVTLTRTATVTTPPPGLVGAANPGAWNLSAPVTWTLSPGLLGMSWRLRYRIDQPAGVNCTP
jgi:hypothetical protein